jgi:hypothetical protein
MQVVLDMSQIKRVAEDLKVAVDQIPYAISRAMNDAVFATREKLVNETWPRHVQMRRASFPSAVLHVDRSDKHNLTVAIREVSSTAPNLTLHAEGGTKTPARTKRFSIPLKGWVVRTAEGVRKDQTPRAIINRTPKRALRITQKGIFVGEGGRLHLRYSFKQSVVQPKDVPFYEDFEQFMTSNFFELLPSYLQLAMRTRKPR